MGIHSSVALSRAKAAEIVASAIGNDEDLKELASYILAKYTLFNVYKLDEEDNADAEAEERLALGREHGGPVLLCK